MAARQRRTIFGHQTVKNAVSEAEMKILIVDDHADMRALIRSVVAGLATEVLECADGAAAVEAYKGARLSGEDRVLMDLQMPGVDGLEATRRLLAKDPDARVIVVTQYGDPHVRAAAAQAGACGFVTKNNLFELERLLNASR